MDFHDVFILFMSFSLIGYILEIYFIKIESYFRKVPYEHPTYGWLPLSFPYGFGAIASIFFALSYTDANIFISIVFCWIGFLFIEYASALFCEYILKTKYWDYSYLKHHIKGRVCLRNSIFFTIGGLFVIKYFTFPSIQLLEGLSTSFKDFLFIILVVIFLSYLFLSNRIKGLLSKLKNVIFHRYN